MKTHKETMVQIAITICLAAILATGCRKGEPAGKGQQGESKPTVVRVGYIPIAECAPLYIGIAKHYFEQEGIKVELEPMKGGAVILPAVQKGDLHIGFTNVVSVVALNAKRDRTDPTFVVCFVGATYERKGHTNHALLCRKDAKLELADLNKPEIKFAVNTTRNIEELMLRRYLAAKGLQVKTLNLVPISFPEMLKALERDEVQVASIVEPFIEPALRTGKYRCIAKQYQEVAPDTIVATYAVTQKWLKENRDIAIKFARAFEKANSFINTDDVEARQIIGSYTRIGKEDLPIIGLPAFEMKIKPESLSELIDEMIQYSFIDKNYNLKPEDMIAPPQGE